MWYTGIHIKKNYSELDANFNYFFFILFKFYFSLEGKLSGLGGTQFSCFKKKKRILFIPVLYTFLQRNVCQISLIRATYIHVVYLMSRYSCQQTPLIPGWWPRCGITLRTPATTSLSLTSVNHQSFRWYSLAWIFVVLMKIKCSFKDTLIRGHQYSWALLFVIFFCWKNSFKDDQLF